VIRNATTAFIQGATRMSKAGDNLTAALVDHKAVVLAALARLASQADALASANASNDSAAIAAAVTEIQSETAAIQAILRRPRPRPHPLRPQIRLRRQRPHRPGKAKDDARMPGKNSGQEACSKYNRRCFCQS
jgi:hypothetical protein